MQCHVLLTQVPGAAARAAAGLLHLAPPSASPEPGPGPLLLQEEPQRRLRGLQQVSNQVNVNVLTCDLFQWRRHWPRLPQLPVSRLHVLAAVALLREGGNKSPNIFCIHINNQHLCAQVSPTHLVLTLLPASLADLKQLTLSEDTVARYLYVMLPTYFSIL